MCKQNGGRHVVFKDEEIENPIETTVSRAASIFVTSHLDSTKGCLTLLHLNVDYKAIVIKIRHAVLETFEQLYKIFEHLFQFEQLLSNFLAYFLSNF